MKPAEAETARNACLRNLEKFKQYLGNPSIQLEELEPHRVFLAFAVQLLREIGRETTSIPINILHTLIDVNNATMACFLEVLNAAEFIIQIKSGYIALSDECAELLQWRETAHQG